MDVEQIPTMNVAVLCGMIWSIPILSGVIYALSRYSSR